MTGSRHGPPAVPRVVRARRWLIAAIVVAAAVLALVWSLTQPSRYDGQRRPAVRPYDERRRDHHRRHDRHRATCPSGRRRRTSRSPRWTPSRRTSSAGSRPGDGRASSRTPSRSRRQGASDVVTVTAEWDSPTKAAALANAFATRSSRSAARTAQADIQRAIDAADGTGSRRPKTPAATALADACRPRSPTSQALKEATTGNVHLVERRTPPDHRSSPKPAAQRGHRRGGRADPLALRSSCCSPASTTASATRTSSPR